MFLFIFQVNKDLYLLTYLHDQDAKKVCDRVRSEWRGVKNGKNPESDSAAELPGEEETLSDKMSHFLSSSTEFVPPSNSSYLSRNIFSRDDIRLVTEAAQQASDPVFLFPLRMPPLGVMSRSLRFLHREIEEAMLFNLSPPIQVICLLR